MATFCTRPFNDLTVQRDGSLAPCCLIHVSGPGAQKFTAKRIDAYLASAELAELRDALVEGVRHEACRVCWRAEDQGLPSMRRDAPLAPGWHHVHIKVGTTCNFKCRMCSPGWSTAWVVEEKEHRGRLRLPVAPAEGVMDPLADEELFRDLLERVVPYARSLMLTGGEPLLCPSLPRFLREVKARGHASTIIQIITNLSTLRLGDVDYLALFESFPNLSLIVSCDGAGPAAEYGRTGLSWPTMVEHLAAARPLIDTVNCVVHVYSVESIPELVELCIARGIGVHFDAVMQDHFCIQILPPDVKHRLSDTFRGWLADLRRRRVSPTLIEAIERAVPSFLARRDLSQTLQPYIFRLVNDELDRRRGTDFRSSFPGLASWYDGLDPAGLPEEGRRALARRGLLEGDLTALHALSTP